MCLMIDFSLNINAQKDVSILTVKLSSYLTIASIL